MNFKKEKIKQTEITKLSKLPWPIINLREICKPEYGYTTSAKNFGKYRFVRITDIDDNGLLKLENKKYILPNQDIQKFILKKLDVLVVRTGATYGKVLLFEDNEPAVFASYLIRLCFSKNKINHKFYWFFSRSKTYWNQVQSLVSGAGQPQFNANAIVKIKIPLPPLDEQKKIASVLSQIQQNINIKDQLIKTTKELKKSVMKHLFTYGVKGEKTKQTEIGQLPESWNISTLDKLFDLKQGQSLSSKKRTGKYLKYFLRTSNVLWGHLDLSKLDQMDVLPKNRASLLLQKDDLLICEGGDIGRTAIWNKELKECYFQNHIHRLRVKDKNTSSLFYMYWMDAGIRIINVYGTFGNRTTIPNLSGKRLLQFSVPLSSLDEQKKIAGILQKIDERIKNYKEQKASLQDLFKSMLHKLMTAQIRLHNIKNINTEIVRKVELQ